MSKNNNCFFPGCDVGNNKHRKEFLVSTPHVKYPSLFTAPKKEINSPCASE